jgi:DNA-binding LacI/PurR family transcriptional regulator
MREALDRWPDLTAVFGVNDSVAIGAPRSAAELARQAPRDLAVFGFDDISWAALNQPPLRTVHVYKRRIGQLAAQCVLDCIAQPEAAPTRTTVAAKLVLRASCGHAD